MTRLQGPGNYVLSSFLKWENSLRFDKDLPEVGEFS